MRPPLGALLTSAASSSGASCLRVLARPPRRRSLTEGLRRSDACAGVEVRREGRLAAPAGRQKHWAHTMADPRTSNPETPAARDRYRILLIGFVTLAGASGVS